jgi:uncharacterized SAM-binding protein YcdF (DUF218 family)
MMVQPLAVAILLMAAGLWAPRNRMLRRVAIAAWIGLFLWSWAPVSWLTSGSLEWRYPVRLIPAGDAEAIVVLSANVIPPNASRPEPEADRNTYMRCRYAAWLYHHWRSVPIVAAGGNTDQGVAMTPVMRHVLEAEGVPPEQIWTEDTSTTTYENARNSAVLLRARGIGRIVLVTEAYHMPRSEGSFRKQGLTVVPAPFGYRSLNMRWGWRDWRRFIPNSGEQLVNNDNLHEWVGLVWYRLSGKI